jgi:hypothetical protein
MSFGERATLRFINVDLDVESVDELQLLAAAMEPHAYSLTRPPGQASFEVNEADPKDPEAVILEFTRIVKSLPPEARRVWDGASKRVFDVGMQSGRHPSSVSCRIGVNTLREAADIDADIVITIYALDPADDDQ